MNGYSKISNGTAQKTRPKDFSDFYYSFHPQTPKPQEEEEDDDESDNNKQVVKKEKEDGGVVGINNNNNNSGERFGVVLGRSVSVSSSSSSGFLQLGRVKRAFSMRRSSSVSERYCRIHDQYMAIASPPLANNNNNIDEDDHHQIIDDGDEIRTSRRRSSSMKMKKLRGGKIVKACKRLLGL
ncbi:hypothetical protein RIF29_13785 [Crotalaria pallida]|uniref:Uncharacterized protein n=1 Tax=Crotalaria pallida TaxID=3830 RepID=A0AAN9IQ87_CROPI